MPKFGASEKGRETWSNSIQFVLVACGWAIGFGNVWRFPYQAFRNGGGIFVLIYIFFAVGMGVPLWFLEVGLGQFMKSGSLKVWDIYPLARGIGWSAMISLAMMNIYYCVIVAWVLLYMFYTITNWGHMPWTHCDNEWNTPRCVAPNASSADVAADRLINGTAIGSGVYSAAEFWQLKVLNATEGVEHIGGMQWEMVIALFVAWVLIFLSLCFGLKISGTIVYFTVLGPYFFLVVMAIYGLTLPGAFDGLRYFFQPDFSKAFELQVWADAGTQVYYSFAVGLGALIAIGSHNPFKHDSLKESVIFAFIDVGTSLLAGMVVFPVIGYMAHQTGRSIEDVAESGPGLIFITYPTSAALLPFASFFTLLFFFILLLIGVDSQFAGVEGFVDSLLDFISIEQRPTHASRVTVLSVTCILKYLLGLTMVTRGGIYVFQLMDYFAASRIIVLLGLAECITVCYGYGIKRFYGNLEDMLGYRPLPHMMIFWTAITPIIIIILLIINFITSGENLRYKLPLSETAFVFPDYYVVGGWTISFGVMCLIPIIAVAQILCLCYKPNMKSLLARWKYFTRPILRRPEQLRDREDPDLTTFSAATRDGNEAAIVLLSNNEKI